MQARLALIAAVACGALAVTAVAVDLAYTLTVSIETQDEDGTWVLIEQAPREDRYDREVFYGGSGCAGPDIRVVVDNHRPIGATRDVRIAYENASSGRQTVVADQEVKLDSMDRETFRFTIPENAFPAENESSKDRPFPVAPGGTYVEVRVDDLFIGACIQRTAPEPGTHKEVPA